MIRDSIADPEDTAFEVMAFGVTFGAPTTEPNERAAVAGLRGDRGVLSVGEGETGLDHCEARCWHGRPRPMPPTVLGLAFPAGLGARLRAFAGV